MTQSLSAEYGSYVPMATTTDWKWRLAVNLPADVGVMIPPVLPREGKGKEKDEKKDEREMAKEGGVWNN